eukprot:5162813-Prymnesium_polylepis.1
MRRDEPPRLPARASAHSTARRWTHERPHDRCTGVRRRCTVGARGACRDRMTMHAEQSTHARWRRMSRANLVDICGERVASAAAAQHRVGRAAIHAPCVHREHRPGILEPQRSRVHRQARREHGCGLEQEGERVRHEPEEAMRRPAWGQRAYAVPRILVVRWHRLVAPQPLLSIKLAMAAAAVA